MDTVTLTDDQLRKIARMMAEEFLAMQMQLTMDTVITCNDAQEPGMNLQAAFYSTDAKY